MIKNQRNFSHNSSNEIPKPPIYKVILIDNELASYHFILKILTLLFNQSIAEAEDLFLRLKDDGKVTIGNYCNEIAITKKFIAEKNAEINNILLDIHLEKL